MPGSSGAVFVPSKKTATPAPGLAVATYREGRVVGLSEVLLTTPTEANASQLATTEYAHLRQVVPGFTLEVVKYPLVATVLWAAGTVALAALLALTPVAWRRRSERRKRERQAELDRLAALPAHHIVKHRR